MLLDGSLIKEFKNILKQNKPTLRWYEHLCLDLAPLLMPLIAFPMYFLKDISFPTSVAIIQLIAIVNYLLLSLKLIDNIGKREGFENYDKYYQSLVSKNKEQLIIYLKNKDAFRGKSIDLLLEYIKPRKSNNFVKYGFIGALLFPFYNKLLTPVKTEEVIFFLSQTRPTGPYFKFILMLILIIIVLIALFHIIKKLHYRLNFRHHELLGKYLTEIKIENF